MITVNVDCFVWLNVYPFCNSRTPSWRASSIVNLPNSCSIDLQAYGSQNTRLLGRLQPKKQVNLTICWGERQRRKLQGDVLWRLTVTKKKLFVTIKYFLWSCQISWTQLLFCFWSIHIGNPVLLKMDCVIIIANRWYFHFISQFTNVVLTREMSERRQVVCVIFH